jgi:integrase
MERVNLERGSLKAVPKGQTFADAVKRWRSAIAPNLSPSTVRPRESYLPMHITPRFGQLALHEIGVHELQQFATDMRQIVSGKTVVQVLATVFGVLHYAEKCGMKVSKVGMADLELGTIAREMPVAFFTREQAQLIITEAKEPFKTLFSVAWFTGLRAGETLTLDDLDFTNKTVRVNKSSDDNTRESGSIRPRRPLRCYRCRPRWKRRCGITFACGNQTKAASCFRHVMASVPGHGTTL